MQFVDLVKDENLAHLITDLLDEGLFYCLSSNSSVGFDRFWVAYYNKQPIGLVYIYDYKKAYKKCSIGFGIFKEFRGSGLAKKLLSDFCDYLENELGMIRIQSAIDLTNYKSLILFASNTDLLGFEYEGTARNYWGSDVICAIYSRCKKED